MFSFNLPQYGKLNFCEWCEKKEYFHLGLITFKMPIIAKYTYLLAHRRNQG